MLPYECSEEGDMRTDDDSSKWNGLVMSAYNLKSEDA